MTTQQTLTPQNAFPLVGSLENADTVASIGRLLLHEENGIIFYCQNQDERQLCDYYDLLLERYPNVSREEWARLKELALLQHGSPIASTIDYLCSAHRTPAIAESAIRSAGFALYQAAERTEDKAQAVDLFRRVMASVIAPPSADEFAAQGMA